MVAGIVSLEALDPSAFERLERLGERVRKGLGKVIVKKNAPFSITGLGSLFRIHPKVKPPASYREAFQHPEEAALMKNLAKAMLQRGVMMPSAATSSLSTAMKEADIDSVIDAFDSVLVEDIISLD